MAKSDAVWGIDIGQCALKALRCRAHDKDPNRLVVDAFDYIEYPKILSQPEADRETLVREALEQFVSRNELAGDRVAISVPGQSGLARFIKLPPVEAKKIPDIVKYEARQQIPFALNDVVWDYQPLAGSREEGYAVGAEVGLFAMKRDQVTRALQPLEQAGIDVDIIQLAPLAIYNFTCFDRLGNLESLDPNNPPPWKVVISLGTDATDLVITNGLRVWQRSIPIGGNHFTKSLTKELKLTFAKAEHLKRNAMKAENPKAVFQAMRPVFSDLVAEIQRSLGFFTSNNRDAQLDEIIALGNPMKLPGLQKYLSQNLDQNVTPVDQFVNLVGGTVTSAPQFKNNQLTFAIAYGLCVQALGRSLIKTNLLPDEIVTTRLVSAKKPWAVAAAAVLLLSIAANYVSHYSAWRSANVSDPVMASALRESETWSQSAQQLSTTFSALTASFEQITQIGRNLQSNVDGRLLWLELLKAVDTALPKDERPLDAREATVKDISHREELHITSMDCQYFEDLSQWYMRVEPIYLEAKKSAIRASAAGGGAAEGDEAAVDQEEYAEEAPPEEGGEAEGASPSGPGWVIQMVGHHFHNGSDMQHNEGEEFIHNTFFKNLEEGTVSLPDGPNGELIEVPIKELGISHPVVLTKGRIVDVTYQKEAADDSAGPRGRGVPFATGGAGRSTSGQPTAEDLFQLRQYDFIVQFCWQPKPRNERREKGAGEDGVLPGTAAVEEDASPDSRERT